MIRYNLLCEHDHKFEAWFRDSAAYEEQVDLGEIQCPFCGNDQIRKAVMAPAVASRKEATYQPARAAAIEAAQKVTDDMREGADLGEVARSFMEIVGKLQRHVEETCDYVGEKFADEARAIHYGEAEERGIYGEATAQETKELREEGIEVMALPKTGDKKQAN